MLIDCDRCAARGPGCPDCVVTVLLGGPGQRLELDEVECQALAVLADGGLVPPLRLIPQPAEPAQTTPKRRPPEDRDQRASGDVRHRRSHHAAG
jgi:hypothetical protein